MQQEELIGEKYRLGPVIGSGGIATVRRATHLWTERKVAVKLLDPELPHFEELRAGFLREARATVQLNHPNVVDVLDMGEDGWDTVYMVMELLHGPTLRDVLLEHGKLSEEDTLAILLPLLDALEKAHELGIVHRDFKPENIMLPLDAYDVVTPKLLDFGIAEMVRDTQSQSASPPDGVIMGTPHYMSPEQARDHRTLIGPHTDVWGVAVVWYECLTGRPPFDGDSAEEVLRAVCEAPIDFAGVPDKYVPLLRDALHRLPGFRMASVSDLKARIEEMGFARATVPPAQTSLSSVPAPTVVEVPETSESAPPLNGTLVGLGPDQLFAPTPSPIQLDSEVIRLPTKSSRAVWLAGAALAISVGLGAWWAVRDRGAVPDGPSEPVFAQPASVPENLEPEPEPEPLEAEEVEHVEETLGESNEELFAELEEPEAEPPASTEEPETAALVPSEEPAAEAAEAVEKPAETATAEEPKVAPRKPKRSKPRVPKQPKNQPTPDLVTEW